MISVGRIFVLEDTIPAAKEGRIQELVDSYFENN